MRASQLVRIYFTNMHLNNHSKTFASLRFSSYNYYNGMLVHTTFPMDLTHVCHHYTTCHRISLQKLPQNIFALGFVVAAGMVFPGA